VAHDRDFCLANGHLSAFAEQISFGQFAAHLMNIQFAANEGCVLLHLNPPKPAPQDFIGHGVT
jgi:hypothetical protein